MPEETLDRVALAELLETVGGDQEFLVELIETYLGDSPILLVDLRDGLTAGDAAAVRRAAHTLKSTSASFGATRLATTCREIEAAAGAEGLGALGPRVEEAAAEFEAVAAALRAIADAGGAA
ncbi:MAG: Hpt domain-containing protein [Chloroflexi bacterium]|nr:Hpt domain-containing protein [Chloroflexota bacterium]